MPFSTEGVSIQPSWIADRTLLVWLGVLLSVVAFRGSGSAAGPDVTWREIMVVKETPAGLLQSPEEFAAVIPPRAAAVEGIRSFTEALADVYETFDNPPETHYFFCTVYYTPRETGFTKERGFDVRSTKPRGLSRSFPADFVKATTIEGFGQMKTPTSGGSLFLKYDGTWGYRNRILGNRNNTLQDRESIAVHRRHSLFRSGVRVWILDHELYNTFGALRYQTADTGGGLYRSQIDLYWGEDDPLGPGADIWRPAACDVAVRWIVPVLIWR